ncbi:MAG TPA: hypothetical protein VKG38_05960 [Solirubrobacteraceae bacterium]|nr:hypothetical protein [Solirubrobacteraceae bacterium]
MSNFRNARLFLLPVLAGCALLLGLFSASASAETYGELRNFHAGVELGSNLEDSSAFGVDPTDGNSIYVGGEPKLEQYVVKKFSETGTELASVTITPPAGEYKEGTEGIEGVAIDSKEKRLYVLIRYARLFRHQRSTTAGALYAFSTTPESKKLVPAAGITNSEGLFATTATLDAASKTHAGTSTDPLFSPAGITVDPSSHEVIILATDEEAEEKVVSTEPHMALQRVAINSGAAKGTPAGELGKRYVDPELSGLTLSGDAEHATSPVVSPAGDVYVAQQVRREGLPAQEVDQVPSNFESTAPKPVYQTFARTALATRPWHEWEQLVELDPTEEWASKGDGLSLIEEASGSGRFYVFAHIAEDEPEEQEEGFTSEFQPGVLALKYAEEGANTAEFGWTGGHAPNNNPKKEQACNLGPSTERAAYPLVAAASGGKVFALGWTGEKPRVVEFGAGGSGCNMATATVTAEVEEKPVAVSESVPAGTEVELSSLVSDGNALEVEWNFDEGGKATVSKADQHQETLAKHDFEGNGPGGLEPKVTEIIHTDDLASPVIEATRTFKLTEAKPIVTKQPAPATVAEGASAEFTAMASGGKLEVQWQVKKGGGAFENDTTDKGTTTDTLTISPVTAAENGNEYRAVFKNTKGSAESKGAKLTVSAGSGPPVVTKAPTSIEVAEGTNASFEATATGATSVQWQVKKGGGAFENDTTDKGTTTDTLTVENTTPAENGNEYRAVFKGEGETPTTAAKLTVATKPVVTKAPTSIEVAEGTNASFEATATGATSVQWQVKKGGGAFENDTTDKGTTTDTLTVESTTPAENGNEYRAVFKNGPAQTETTAAKLTVAAKPVVTKDPAPSVEVEEGTNASFEATATGATSVQWQVKKGAGLFENDTTDKGHAEDKLTVEGTTVAESGNEYRAVFKNGPAQTETTAAKLTVDAKPVITKAPTAIAVEEGTNASFEATATGATSVQWQVKRGAGSFENDTTDKGHAEDKLTVEDTTPAENGNEYRAVFKNGAAETETTAAKLTVTVAKTVPVVTKDPTSIEVAEGTNASFEATATGATSVQWQVKKGGGVFENDTADKGTPT